MPHENSDYLLSSLFRTSPQTTWPLKEVAQAHLHISPYMEGMLSESGTNLKQIQQFDWISRSTFVQVLQKTTSCSREQNMKYKGMNLSRIILNPI